MEPTIGIEPMNLFLTKEVLYLLSYVGLRACSQQEGVEKVRREIRKHASFTAVPGNARQALFERM
jgi:hypothetical protein